MLAEVPTRERSRTLSPEQSAAVLVELDAILASPTFAASKRCHDFLDCIVRHALAGHYDNLNERFLGVELFGRKVDFDTGADSIVRVRASDVRRRLAQYYSERSESSVVTIGLSSGTYVPTFHWHTVEEVKEQAPKLPSASGTELPSAPLPLPQPVTDSGGRSLLWLLRIGLALLVVMVAIMLGRHFWSVDGQSVVEQFWGPFLQNKTKVTLSLGDSHLYWLSSDLRQKVEDNQPASVRVGDIVKASGGGTQIGDVRGIVNITGFLNSHGLATQVLWPEESRNLSLDHTNAIYIGAFNNVWAMNLNRNLRFYFDFADGDHGPIWFIHDRQHPEKRWITEKTTAQRNDRSYALITRIIDPDRKRVQMAIGGVNEFGTQAACEFLTDSTALSEFARTAPRGWQNHNLQILLEMDISGTVVVNPKVVAVQVW